MSPTAAVRTQLAQAVQACEEKKASNISILQLEKNGSAFTDYFILASGANPRQIQTIADSVQERLERQGSRATHVEGYNQAEWVLLDYVDFVVHIFSESARSFYDLERLWRSARKLSPHEVTVKRKRVSAAAQKRKRPSSPRKSAARKPVRKKRS